MEMFRGLGCLPCKALADGAGLVWTGEGVS